MSSDEDQRSTREPSREATEHLGEADLLVEDQREVECQLSRFEQGEKVATAATIESKSGQ